jgi:N utilization substance protein A
VASGSKIDIIPWHLDPAKFVCNALAPAEISRVVIDESNQSMEVIVPDEFLSIAIGKKGQNVRLASKLSGWHLDVKSETRYTKAMQSGYDSLVALPGVGISMADTLYEAGFYSAEEVSRAAIEDLVQIRGIGEEKAKKLLEGARLFMETKQSVDEDDEPTNDRQMKKQEDEKVEDTENQEVPTDDAEAAQARADENTADTEESETDTDEPAESAASQKPDADTDEPAESAASEEDETDKSN